MVDARIDDLDNKFDELKLQFDDIKTNRTEFKGMPLLPANVKLPVYSGPTDDKTFGEHIEALNDLGNALGWSKGQLCAHLPLSLKGEARQAYNSLEQDKKNNWKQATDAMAAKMKDRDTGSSRALRQFMTLQQDGKLVVEFGAEIRRLVKKAYRPADGFTEDQREKIAIEQFREGLDPELKERVIFGAKKATLNEEISDAMDAEEKLKSIRAAKDKRVKEATEKAEKRRLEEEVNSIRQEQVAYVQAYGPAGQQGRQGPPYGQFRPFQISGQRPDGQNVSYTVTGQLSGSPELGPPGSGYQNANQYGGQQNRNFWNRAAEWRPPGWNRVRQFNPRGAWQRFQQRPFFNRFGRNQQDRNAGGGGYNNFGGRNDQRNNGYRGYQGPSRGGGQVRGRFQRRGRGGQPFRATMPLMSVVSVIAILAVLFTSVSAEESNVFQICSLSHGAHFMQRPTLQSCEPPHADEWHEVSVELFVPRTVPVMVPAYRCSVRNVTVCTYSFFGGIIDKQQPKMQYGPVSEPLCWKLVDEKVTEDNRTLVQVDKDLWHTDSTVTPGRRIFGERCESVLNYYAQQGVVGSMYGTELVSDLGRSNNCSFSAKVCNETTGTIVWKVPDQHAFCSHESAGTFHGMSTREHLAIEAIQAGFLVSKDTSINDKIRQCLPRGIVRMENDVYALFSSGEPDAEDEAKSRRRRSATFSKEFSEKLRAMGVKMKAFRMLARTPWRQVMNNSAILQLAATKPRGRSPCSAKQQVQEGKNNRLHPPVRPQSRHSGPDPEPIRPTSFQRGQFPYWQPLQFVATYHNGTSAKPYWLYETPRGDQVAQHIAQMPHGSLITFPLNLTRYFIFWENGRVTMYRKAEWNLEEQRRLGQGYTSGRGYRTIPEDFIDIDYAENDASNGTLTAMQMQEYMQQWNDLREKYDVIRDLERIIDEREQLELDVTAVDTDGEDAKEPTVRKRRAETGVKPLENREEEQRLAAEEARKFEEERRKREEQQRASSTARPTRPTRPATTTTMTTVTTKPATRRTNPTLPTTVATKAITTTTSQPVNGRQEHPKGNEQMNHDLNVKLQFTADKLNKHIRDTFVKLWKQICEVHNTQIRIWDAITTFAPTQGVRGLLRRSDVYATFFGQVLAVTPCTKVRADVVYWNRTVNSTCYEEVPVRINKTLWFVQEGTIDLKREGRKIECDQKRQSVYKANSTWFTADGHPTHVAELAQKIAFKHHQKPIDFTASSIFNADFTAVGTSVSLLSSYINRINSLEASVVRITPPLPHPIVTGVKTLLEDVADVANGTYQAAKDKITSWDPLEQIFTKWYHWALAVLGVFVAVLALIGCWYTAPIWWPVCSTLGKLRRRHIEKRRRQKLRRSKLAEDGKELVAFVEGKPRPDIILHNYVPECCQVIIKKRSVDEQNFGSAVLPIVVNGMSLEAVLDTASDISTMDITTFMLCNTALLREERTVRAVNGTEVELIGQAIVVLQVSRQVLLRAEFWVRKDAHANSVLIGIPIIRELNDQLGDVSLHCSYLKPTPTIRAYFAQELESPKQSLKRKAKSDDEVVLHDNSFTTSLLKPAVMVRIGERYVRGSWDTAAAISLGTERFAEDFRLPITYHATKEVLATNGTAVPVVGFSQTEMTLGNSTVPCRLYLMASDSNCAKHLIIGTDIMGMLYQMGSSVSFNVAKQTVIVNTDNIFVPRPDCAYADFCNQTTPNIDGLGTSAEVQATSSATTTRGRNVEVDARPWVYVTLNGIGASAQVDTASKMSVMSRDFAEAKRLRVMEYQQASDTPLQMLNASILGILGEALVDVQWQQATVSIKVLVVKDMMTRTYRYADKSATDEILRTKFVLGTDFLSSVSPQEGTLRIRETTSGYAMLEVAPALAVPLSPKMQVFPTTTSEARAKLLYLNVGIGPLPDNERREQQTVRGLFDTGSDRCYIRELVLQQRQIAVMGKPTTMYRPANGTSFHVKGEAVVRFEVGGVSLPLSILAVPDEECIVPMIFGADVMQAICLAGHELQADFEHGCVYIDGQEVAVSKNSSVSSNDVVCASGKALRVKLKVNNRTVKALFDTGCSLTFVSWTVAVLLGLMVDTSDTKQALAANGSRLHFDGSALVKIELKERTVWHRVYVTKDANSPAPMVMGTDLIGILAPDHRVVLDFAQRKVRFANDALDFVNAVVDENFGHQERRIRLKVTEDLRLKPRSDNFVKVEFCEQPSNNFTYFVSERPHRYTVMVGKSVHLVQPDMWYKGRYRTFIRVLNGGNNEVLIRANSVIAQAEEISPDDISPPVYEVNAVQEEIPEGDRFRSKRWNSGRTRVVGQQRWQQRWTAYQQQLWEAKLKRELDLSKCIMTPAGKVELTNLLRDHGASFLQDDGKIGRYNGPIKATIQLEPWARPFQERPRRIPHALEPEIRRQLQVLEDQQVIRKSSSPYASPIVIVRKPNGVDFRMCVDYRRLNAQMTSETYIIPLMTDLIDRVAGHKLFSCFDMAMAFHQVPVAEEDVYKTAFVTPFGSYEYLCLPFGVKNGPVIMTRVMEDVRRYLTSSFFVYIDDTCLVSNSEWQHLKDLKQFFEVMEHFGLRLRLEKCAFGLAEVKYLGVLVSEKGIKPDPQKVASVASTKVPKTLTELRAFIGAASYWRRFIENFAKIMAPLYELTRKDGKVIGQNGRVISMIGKWSPECQQAFETVIQKLVSAPVLAAPWIGHPYQIECDASKVAFGACLMQKGKDGQVHPICYASKLTNKSQAKFPSVELEAAALAWSLLLFSPYIVGSGTTIVRTDNSAMCSLMKKRDATLTGRLARYQMAIQHFDVQIVHKSGASNRFADFLSRHPGTEAIEADAEGKEELLASIKAEQEEVTAVEDRDFRLTPARIHHAQMEVEGLRNVFNALKHNKFPKDARERKQLKERLSGYSLDGDIICRKGDAHPKIIVPLSLREKIIVGIHEDPMESAHLGIAKTQEKIARRFWWQGLSRDTAKIVNSCLKCQLRKSPAAKLTTEPLHRWPAPKRAYERLHCDLAGPYVRGHNDLMVVLITVDALTKWATVSPLRRQTAELIAEAFERDVLCQKGVPRMVVSDQANNIAAAMALLTEEYGFVHHPISAYHQAGNGQCERFVGVLANMLSCFVNKHGSDWPKFTHRVCFAYNTSVHATIGQSPFYMMHGREALTRWDMRSRVFEDENVQPEAEEAEGDRTLVQSKRLSRTLQAAWKAARDVIERKEVLRNQYADEKRRARPHSLKVHQLVLRYVHQAPEEQRHKFRPLWQGPYRLLRFQGPNAIIRRLAEGDQKEVKVHVDQLKAFEESVTLPLHAGDDAEYRRRRSEEPLSAYHSDEDELGAEGPGDSSSVLGLTA